MEETTPPAWDPKTCHIAALILARGGSKGVPLKNIRECCGIPLLGWILGAVRESGMFDSVWVSTDHDQIAEVARKYGAQVHRRTPEVSLDTSKSIETTHEFLKYHPEIEVVGLLSCTTPTLRPEHLLGVKKLIREDGYEAVFSVVRKKMFRWKEVSQGETTKPINFDPDAKPSRRDFAGELVESGAFYFTRAYLLWRGTFQAGKLTYYETPREEHVDVDAEFDFLLAETLLKGIKERDQNGKNRLET